MKATCIELTKDRATIELTPCWLARLFGSRVTICTLERGVAARRWAGDEEVRGWFSVASGIHTSHLQHGELMLRAIDFRPVATLPEARTI